MSLINRLHYYSRIFSAYITPAHSHLSFWHEKPELNVRAQTDDLGEYYMTFAEKADYAAEMDDSGVPFLNYRGHIGRQYNPIAIAQWGLGNYNQFCRTNSVDREKKLLKASDWLCTHLEQNAEGAWVWNHYFDWEYRTRLQAPWYSALAQGQGISLLARAYRQTSETKYLDAAQRAFGTFLEPVSQGGVSFTDNEANLWFEEYIVTPPTHILNGFIWASWGVFDYFLLTRSGIAGNLFEAAIKTLHNNLARYDLGYWSLYEQSGTWLPMIASPFYHRLHIVQLRVMHRITGDDTFRSYAEKWQSYDRSGTKRVRALCSKSVFKLCYY